MSPLPSHRSVPAVPTDYELSPVRGLWSVVVPEATTNYFLDPSFESSTAPSFTAVNATITRVTNWQARGVYGIQIAPTVAAVSSLAYTAINPTTVGLAGSTIYTWSFYLKGAGGESFTATATVNGSATSKSFKATGGVDRVSLTFTTPASVGTTSNFKIQKDSTTTQTYWTDAWQLEAKSYATSYCDGDQSGCYWNGPAYAATSARAAASQGGKIYNFYDLGFRITSDNGAGMAGITNISIPYGILGGAVYQRTVSPPRPVVLSGVVEGRNLQELQTRYEQLINLLSPNNVSSTAAPLILLYQTTDSCGNAIGKQLEVEVVFDGGLEGQTDNLYQRKIALKFVEYLPPGFRENTDIGTDLNYQTTPANNGIGLNIRDNNTGSWTNFNTIGSTDQSAFFIDRSDNVWYGNTITINDASGAGTVAVSGGAVRCFAQDGQGYIYAGGDFTSPAAKWIYWNGSSWAAVTSTSLTGTVVAIGFDDNNNAYAVTQSGGVGKVYQNTTRGGGSTSLCDTVGGVPSAITKGRDGLMYVGGAFTSISWSTGPTYTLNTPALVARYNPFYSNPLDQNAWGAVGSSIQVTAVNALVTGKDGTIYAGGTSVSAGAGVSSWNGSSWQTVGTFFFGQFVYSLLIDPVSGDLYAAGQTNNTFSYGPYSYKNSWFVSDTINYVYRFNGVYWSPVGLGWYFSGSAGTVTISGSRNKFGMNIYVGHANNRYSALTQINYQGSANEYPVFIFRGQSYLFSIENYTTGKRLYFGYPLVTGEVCRLNLAPDKLSFTSNIKGDVLNRIQPGSDITGFGLVEGVNNLQVLVVNSTPTNPVSLIYRNRHWASDASGGS